jgi:hypothetical protein
VHDEHHASADELADAIGDDEFALDDAELSELEANAHTLVVRRADGTEIVTLSTLAAGEPWAVFMQPGGAVQNAYTGAQDRPNVWVDTDAHEISRDDDGTYVIEID